METTTKELKVGDQILDGAKVVGTVTKLVPLGRTAQIIYVDGVEYMTEARSARGSWTVRR